MVTHYGSANDNNFYSSLKNWSRCKHATLMQPKFFFSNQNKILGYLQEKANDM